ncbi:hypothetical protein CmeUKMEL1_15460 [Cryptosporidium meleagridis]|uniref:Uncharacterized protein n=1 Tax=Cryptosporidium meleagridis TaxID=93969 RepID=A0A2P4Z4W2_9CRYT|nr:hypothetical protein CmeUKMEL1_15460 [Cryptosporidium meleagridis]
MVNVVVCSECNTKNEYIMSIFVKCYFCQCINFVGYPYFGKTFQCIKVLCPRCISYTIVPKDTNICRCRICGLLQYTKMEMHAKTGNEQLEETLTNSEEALNAENSIELSTSKETLNSFSDNNAAYKGNIINNKKKLVLNELKEKWKNKRERCLYELDDITDDLSDYSLSKTLSIETS